MTQWGEVPIASHLGHPPPTPANTQGLGFPREDTPSRALDPHLSTGVPLWAQDLPHLLGSEGLNQTCGQASPSRV